MAKRIPDLLTLYPGFIADTADGVITYDISADTTKASTVANLIPSGINGVLYKVLSSNDAGGGNVNTAQPWFPTTGAVTVASTKTYVFEGYLRTSRSAGTTSHTTSLLFGGTATLTSIAYRAIVNTGDVVTNAAVNQTAIEVATATIVKAASISASEQTSVQVKGIVRINAGGTLIPQFKYDVAPGGAPTVLSNSNFILYPIGTNTVTTSGTWA